MGVRIMKFVRVISNSTHEEGNYGILSDNKVSLIEKSPLEGIPKETGISFPLPEVKRFLCPIEVPNIIALGLNYLSHAIESKMERPKAPVIFLKATTSITGHLEPIILPAEAPSMVDFEAELTVVIGKKCKNITESDAATHIFGYTCGHDVSARDCQLQLDKQWARGKSFDTFSPIGPSIETELDPTSLNLQLRLNGETMQNASTKDMIFPVYELVSYLSHQMTLLPGTLIMTGTPEGIGFTREPQVFLSEGDRVEIEIEGIGILENYVIKEMPDGK
jgi:2-keto-4-pentenoate hydratase/2-oxohepta-3-ene-1,7-dioic acid hydratase in catechol pathway